jgi:hypothetical protein
MASQGYYEWIAAGKPFTLAAPERRLRDILRGYGYTVYDIGNERHQKAEPPEDHMPYSATGWPVKSPRWYGFALDIMPPAADDLPTLPQLLGQIYADKMAGHPGVAWLKYMNWEPSGPSGPCYHDKWQPNHVRTTSGDRGHGHLSGRSDHVTIDTTSGYDPVARYRARTKGLTMFLAACSIGDSGPHVRFLQYSLQDIHAYQYPDEPPLWPVKAGVPQLPPTMDAKTGEAMRRLLHGGNGKDFGELLATRLVKELGAVLNPTPVPGPPGEGVTAAEAKLIAEDVVRRATITPA